MTLIGGQRELTAKERWSVFFILKVTNKKGMENKQMVTSAQKRCIIQLLGYSVEEAYCSLGFDFARVCSSRSNREKLPTDEEFHIRRGFFSYGKKKAANVNSPSKVQLIDMLSLPTALMQECSGSNCLTEVIENQSSPYFLPNIICLF